MLNFAGITHVIDNPKGHAPGYNFSLVGSVPTCMMDRREATQGDIMGGRAYRGEDGKLYAPQSRRWETTQQIKEAFARHPELKLCSSPACGCYARLHAEVVNA